ncbi:HXXEE domain-containing protein [Allokutzneria oryzae]|uniref:HXXEE domain-containing protein n=1 Tax=Allokutzneria oryzae TaxID=1378989 RepID=A0ABV6A2I7_9PSEU
MTSRNENLPTSVTWGLLAAWTLHDAEELLTMAKFSRDNKRWLPEVDQAHVTTAIGLMGAVIATASAAGARTGGRSALFQTVLTGFGLHSLTHLAQSALLRRYTPGVITAPLIVAPFSLWALKLLRDNGIPLRTRASSFLWFPVALGSVHGAAAVITKAVRAWRRG